MEIASVVVFKNTHYDGYEGVQKGQYYGRIDLIDSRGMKIEVPVDENVVTVLIGAAASCTAKVFSQAAKIPAHEIAEASIIAPALVHNPEPEEQF